jgi:tetratricopeptide (TPR) repeat protein
VRTLARGLGLAPLAVAAVLAGGCAHVPVPHWLHLRPHAEERVERPEAPPEYDYLVGRELELDGKVDEALAAYERAIAKDPHSALLLRTTAELLARNGRVDEAVPYAERAFAIAPDEGNIRLFLGTLYRIRKNTAAAESTLRKPDGTPYDSDAALLLYGLYFDSDRMDDAIATAKWMVRADPTNLRSHFALARAYERLKRPKDVERTLRGALKAHPGNLAVYAAIARSRRERGDRNGEIAIYREALRVHPNNHGMLVALADAQIDLGHEAEARRTLEQVERSHPDDLRSSLRLGYLDLEQKRYGAAEARFEKILARNPNQPDVLYFLGTVRREAGDMDGAIEAFGRVPADHERYPDARLQLAGIYERRQDFASALREAEAAQKRAPSRALELYVATLRSKAGDFDGAKAELEAILAASPDDEEVLYNLGVLYGDAGHQDEALATMQKVLEKNQKHAGALNYIGYTWADRGEQLDEAERMIRRALEERPEDGYIVDSLGWVHYIRARQLLDAGRTGPGRRQLELSIQALERAAVLTGGDPVISEHLGDAYLLRADRRGALREYEKAVALEPRKGEQPHLLEKLERLRRELGARSGP